ncbi:MAG: hypothetical protein PHI20_02760 [Endomicrobiaceae bacterium]|jgi:hypothetical protein|nr:hypothetical protein [Endomicrobiaceae bacterium]MDD3729938.1 hypothetical protein [Endomicrobiaceae bacterium]MDD4165863.1 hypothetical protein [Endomicrobiaceae bacterium]
MDRLTVNFSKSTVKLLHKVIACAVLFCIIAGSAESVTFTNINLTFTDSMRVSADTLLSQFFSVSTLPVNAISKMFIETVNKTNVAKDSSSQKHKDKKAKEGSSARASAGYSIIPNNIINSLNFVNKIRYLNVSDNFVSVTYHKLLNYRILERDKVRCLDMFIKFNIMLLLLYILLTRRNISSDDNIINTINKNNMIARLV